MLDSAETLRSVIHYSYSPVYLVKIPFISKSRDFTNSDDYLPR
jgi:hypothetical protein